MALAIKKGDKVEVLTGKDKGKTGKILEILSGKTRVVVESINMVKKHMRRRSDSEPGGIKEIPLSLHISNVALVCPHCEKGTRLNIKVMSDKTKTRNCSKCKQTI